MVELALLLLSRLARNLGCGKRRHLVNGCFGGGVSSSGLSESESPARGVEPIEPRCEARSVAVSSNRWHSAGWVVDVMSDAVRIVNFCHKAKTVVPNWSLPWWKPPETVEFRETQCGVIVRRRIDYITQSR